MTKKLPYANVVPRLELYLIPNILTAKQFAADSDYERRSKYVPLDPNKPIPLYKQSALNHPISKFPASGLKTIHRRLLEARLTDGVRPGFTYRGYLRNYRRKQAKAAKFETSAMETIND